MGEKLGLAVLFSNQNQVEAAGQARFLQKQILKGATRQEIQENKLLTLMSCLGFALFRFSLALGLALRFTKTMRFSQQLTFIKDTFLRRIRTDDISQKDFHSPPFIPQTFSSRCDGESRSSEYYCRRCKII